MAMKTIEIEDDLYLYIAGQTQHIGESASDILRRLLDAQSQLNASSELNDARVGSQALPSVPAEPVMGEDVEADKVISSIQHVEFDFSGIAEAGSSTKRFLALLSQLYCLDHSRFAKACVIKGSKREYFSQAKETLLASGKTSKPQAIPASPYWVITNTNTARKRYILQHVASEMGLQAIQIERVCEAL